MGFLTQLQHGWNAFVGRDPTPNVDYGPTSWYRPDKITFTRGKERTIIAAIYTRIALDVAKIELEHVKLDEQGRYSETLNTGLNRCLTLEANIDQTAKAFVQDIVESMFDEGVVAVIPVEADLNPNITGAYDVLSMRTGRIISWMPKHVKIRAYNSETGKYDDLIMSKQHVAIIPNPFYSVMNESNSVLQRLIHKLTLLDAVDEQTSVGKLDLIVQLPYIIKTEERRKDAERRRKEIENQLSNTKYGIAYTDGSEHITQLNRSLENNLMGQIEYLTDMLYSQLGITKEILDGTADAKTFTNYYSRTIEPIVEAIATEFSRKFLTKTARTKGHRVMYFNKPFDLVPTNDLAELADKFTRNEIMSGNEFRQVIGLKPSDDPKDDMLLNKNIARDEYYPQGEETGEVDPNQLTDEEYDELTANTQDIDDQINELSDMIHSDIELKHYASPYYDPIKAHEYYMKHRQLQGRTNSNSGGSSDASSIKRQLDLEKQQVSADIDKRYQNKSEQRSLQLKTDIQTATRNTQTAILALREQLKSMSKSQIEKARPFIEKQIDALRDANEQTKANIQSRYNNDTYKQKLDENEERQMLEEEYDKRYADELSRLPQTQGASSGSRSSSSSRASSSSKKTKKDYHIWYGYD